MKTLTIKLKQHTPMIHFQHDQEGATLRASEVKPKLDRFILTKLGHGNYEAGIEKAKENKWILGDHNALNYKMRIEASKTEVWDINEKKPYTDKHRDAKKKFLVFENEELLAKTRKSDGKLIPDLNPYPLFFANLDADYRNPDEYKRFSFVKEPIIMTLFFPSISLFDYFNKQEILNDFFFQTNFGTRQSKGFGSFLPIDVSLINYRKKDHVVFDLKIPDAKFGTKELFDKLFYAIDLFYKTLRSGINQKIGRNKEPGIYFKSLMYFYAEEDGGYWDKRTIRYKFNHFTPDIYSDKGEMNEKNHDSKEDIARLYRDMLGLSSSQAWLSYNKDVITKEHVTNDPNKQITRFKSPILIKPIHKKEGSFRILLIPFPIPEEYKNTEFNISSRNSGHEFDFTMKTPEEFDTSDFLDYISDEGIKEFILNQLNEFAHHEKKRVKDDARILISIFNNIRFVES